MSEFTNSGLIGKWVLESSDNFEAFLTKIGKNLIKNYLMRLFTIFFCFKGVNFFLKKAALLVRAPNILIAYDGNDKWSFRIRSTFKNTDTEFKINEEFEEGKNSRF